MKLFDIFKREAEKPSKGNKVSLDEQWKDITKQSQENLKNGNLGLYACNLFALSEIDRKEKRYLDQLKKLVISSYIHLSEAESIIDHLNYGEDIEILTPILPPAVIRSSKTVLKRLNWSIENYKEFFLEIIDTSLTPIHLFSIKDCLDIICLYLEDKDDIAQKKINKGKKLFMANLKKIGKQGVILFRHTNIP